MQETNTFSQNSDQYREARPRYPRELFEWLANISPATNSAWDVGTGNGQAAFDLANHFQTVEATDISKEQVSEAYQHPSIKYSSQPAECTIFPNTHFDLITVAQALHWFDHDKFWPEVIRVAKPKAIFAAWCYHWFETDDTLQKTFVEPLRAILLPFWSAKNKICWDGYQDETISFPFKHLSVPNLAIEETWTFPELHSYLQTWSAYKNALKDPEAKLAIDKLAKWPFDKKKTYKIKMPLTIIAGRISEHKLPA